MRLRQYGGQLFAVASGPNPRNFPTGKEKGIEPISKEKVEEILSRYSAKPESAKGYDAVYLFHMAKADYPTLCPDEQKQAIFVKETLGDIDTSDETTFRKWLATMVGNGEPIMWEDII